MKTEAYFIQHCDDEYCDLGRFQYECPLCHKIISDYDVWWKQWDVYDGKDVFFKCEDCGNTLTVYYEDHNCLVEPFQTLDES